MSTTRRQNSKTNVTIADVARAAGVSTSTVSHVINGTRWVNDDTADSVRSVIDAIGYRPNTLARSLARRGIDAVGIALSTTVNPYFNELAGTIEKACAERGLLVFLADTQEEPKRELEVVEALHGMQVAGIILAPSTYGSNAAVDYLKLHKVPAVLVDRQAENSTFDFVGSENVNAVADLVRRLAERGHRQIAMVSGQRDFSTSAERAEGYRLGLKQAGLPFAPQFLAQGATEIAATRELVKAFFQQSQPPTAIIGGNNFSTLASVAAVQGLGLSIPSDISVVGFDDFEWADHFEPRLTLLAQPWEIIGKQAAGLLVARINGANNDRQIIHYEPECRERSSIKQIA